MTVSPSARHAAVATCALLTLATGAAAQATRQLSVEAIYSPASRADIGIAQTPDYTWLDDRYLISRSRQSGGRRDWLKVDAATGSASALVTPAEGEDVIALNATGTAALLQSNGDLFVRDLQSARTTRLTTADGVEEEATFSPDGRSVAFVRGNNLFVVDVASQQERAITADGSEDLLNGKLDWVYQEEIYGRGRFRAYWWSPDSRRLAFLQIDDRNVPDYTVVDHIPYRPLLEVTAYPKAGDKNPTVKLAVARIDEGNAVWADLSSYASTEILIVDVDWTPDAKKVIYQVQDREQTWLDLDFADAATGAPTRVLRETTKAWVNNLGNPVWLKDRSFLWLSERSGFKHLYRYKEDGTLVKQLTSGSWDIRSFLGADEKSGSAFFTGTERSPLGADVYRVSLDGAKLTRLSQAEGTHRGTAFNPS